MPFLGQDWRSPGQTWVKTEEGWKKYSDEKNNNVTELKGLVLVFTPDCYTAVVSRLFVKIDRVIM